MTSDPISTIAASLSLARSLRVETDYRLRFESPARPWERTTRPGLAGAASTNQKPGLVRMRGADQWEIVRLLLLLVGEHLLLLLDSVFWRRVMLRE